MIEAEFITTFHCFCISGVAQLQNQAAAFLAASFESSRRYDMWSKVHRLRDRGTYGAGVICSTLH